MHSRLKSLDRLAAVYRVLEHANGVSLDRARAALHDVETRIREREAFASRLEMASHEALETGDVNEWLLDQSEIEFTQWNTPVLEEMRLQREAAMREAAEIYQASRMQFEQMQSVVDEVRAAVALEQERAEQRESDDRYLSRQRWQLRDEQQRRVRAERSTTVNSREASSKPMNLS
jgi:hypothetical protein